MELFLSKLYKTKPHPFFYCAKTPNLSTPIRKNALSEYLKSLILGIKSFGSSLHVGEYFIYWQKTATCNSFTNIDPLLTLCLCMVWFSEKKGCLQILRNPPKAAGWSLSKCRFAVGLESKWCAPDQLVRSLFSSSFEQHERPLQLQGEEEMIESPGIAVKNRGRRPPRGPQVNIKTDNWSYLHSFTQRQHHTDLERER